MEEYINKLGSLSVSDFPHLKALHPLALGMLFLEKESFHSSK